MKLDSLGLVWLLLKLMIRLDNLRWLDTVKIMPLGAQGALGHACALRHCVGQFAAGAGKFKGPETKTNMADLKTPDSKTTPVVTSDVRRNAKGKFASMKCWEKNSSSVEAMNQGKSRAKKKLAFASDENESGPSAINIKEIDEPQIKRRKRQQQVLYMYNI